MAWLLVVAAAAWTTAGCSLFGGEQPTRTPVPTFTPTPVGPAVETAPTNTPAPQQNLTPVVTLEPPTPTETPSPLPPTATPTSTPEPTQTSTPTASPEPTATPTASPTPSFVFELEMADKFPTEALAPNVVRVFLYVYSDQSFALEGYSLRVTHNGADLPVEPVSSGGLPDVTRTEPGPYSRFTNMNVIFVEAQAGSWAVQLVDGEGTPVGPSATFELSADEETRELYVRYRQQ